MIDKSKPHQEPEPDDLVDDDISEGPGIDDDLAPTIQTAEAISEPEPEPEPETVVEPERVVERVVEIRRRGFVPAVLGGIFAVALGFGAARTDLLDPYLPDALRTPDYGAALAAQSAAIDDLRARIAAIPPPADLSGVQSRLAVLSDRIAKTSEDLSTRIDALDQRMTVLEGLDARLTALEKRPVEQGASDQAIAAYDRELTALRASIAEQRTEVENLLKSARESENQARALESDAAKSAQVAATQARLAQLRIAIDSGSPYGDLLQALGDDGLTIPDQLRAGADSGVPTLAELVDGFPDAARAALAAARAQSPDGGGIGAFLKRQLGARSVTPRPGDDPDAVLSRAEAAVRGGDLATALNEISTLPEAAVAAMSDWTGQARERLAATAAVDTLAQGLNQN